MKIRRLKFEAKKFTAVICFALCISFLFGNNAVAQSGQYGDNIGNKSYVGLVYSAGTVYELFGSLLVGNKTEPDGVGDSTIVKTPFLMALVHETPSFFGKVKTVFFVGTKVEIKAFSENYCLVESKSGTIGYVFKGCLDGGKDGELSFNRTYDHVYVGATNINATTGNPRTQAKYDGNGTVYYSTDNTDIISVDSETGLITGKNPGKANLIAKVGTTKVSIPVYCIYKWKKEWTGKANTATTVYAGTSTSTASLASLSSGKKFTVKGDDGGSDGWAYGVSESGAWGFVKINDISSKGTVSQYNSMTTVVDNREIPWVYPIKETKFNKISSPYGWRNGNRHLGLDINKGDYSTILDEEIVAPFTGKVVFVNKEYNYTTRLPNYGYCIIMETSSVDPVSGNKLRVVFMHLNEAPSLNAGATVTAGKVIGKIGTTGNSTGPHLHLEINNKGTNFAGMNNSDSFDKTINPIFFYLTSGLKDNSDSTYNEYWYNENK